MKHLGTLKNISFDTENSVITNLFIHIETKPFSTRSFIKFSIRVSKYHDAWFLITSITPLQVYGGVAGTYVESPYCLMETEVELISFVSSLTVHDLIEMSEKAVLVAELKDFV